MKKLHTGVCAIALVSMSLGVANAVPVTVNFSGTIFSAYEGSVDLLGAEASGSISFDTDGLTRSEEMVGPFMQLSFVDGSPLPGPGLFTATLTAGGNEFDISDTYNGGRLGFFDTCTPVCAPGYGESFGIRAVGSSGPLSGTPADGLYRYASVFFLALPPTDPVTGQDVNYFDLSPDFDPLNALTLPVFRSVVLYSDALYDCLGGNCTHVRTTGFDFDVTSLSRVVTTVPEPATLGLLGAGLLGMFAARRRRAGLPA